MKFHFGCIYKHRSYDFSGEIVSIFTLFAFIVHISVIITKALVSSNPEFDSTLSVYISTDPNMTSPCVNPLS